MVGAMDNKKGEKNEDGGVGWSDIRGMLQKQQGVNSDSMLMMVGMSSQATLIWKYYWEKNRMKKNTDTS